MDALLISDMDWMLDLLTVYIDDHKPTSIANGFSKHAPEGI